MGIEEGTPQIQKIHFLVVLRHRKKGKEPTNKKQIHFYGATTAGFLAPLNSGFSSY